METLQPQSSPKRASPWRRALQKLTPPRKSTLRNKSSDHTERKKTKGLFSTPVNKFKKRSKGRKKSLSSKLVESLSDEEQVVTVQVLPKSPSTSPNRHNKTASEFKVCTRPLSPPRILKTSTRTLETENAFDEIFQSYIDKFHNHGDLNVGSFPKCKDVNETIIPQSYLLRKKADLSSAESTSETSCSVNDVRIVKLISKEISDVTLPRPIREPMSTLEVLSRLTLCMSDVANAFACPCGTLSPPIRRNVKLHGQIHEMQDSELDSGSEYGTEDEEEDDGGASTSSYNSASSSCDDAVEK
jgi:hypothetical protein